MSFKAKLYIEGEERNLLDAELVYSQIADYNGRPTQVPVGKPLQLAFESTRNDELFYNYMFHPDRMCKGYIRFFKRDGLQKDFDIEFANAHVINLYERYTATGETPMFMHLTISYGISRVRGTIHEKRWNPSNPFVNEETAIQEEEETSILDLFYENSDGEQISKLRKNKPVFLFIKTSGMVGKSIDLDLSDSDFNFEYNGELLEDDQLLGLEVTADTMKVELITKKQN